MSKSRPSIYLNYLLVVRYRHPPRSLSPPDAPDTIIWRMDTVIDTLRVLPTSSLEFLTRHYLVLLDSQINNTFMYICKKVSFKRDVKFEILTLTLHDEKV